MGSSGCCSGTTTGPEFQRAGTWARPVTAAVAAEVSVGVVSQSVALRKVVDVLAPSLMTDAVGSGRGGISQLAAVLPLSLITEGVGI